MESVTVRLGGMDDAVDTISQYEAGPAVTVVLELTLTAISEQR